MLNSFSFYPPPLLNHLDLIFIRKPMRSIVFILIAALLSACQTINHRLNWPASMPEQKVFVQGFLDKRKLESATEAQLNYHLGWIKKFYLGTKLYPNGWLNASERFLGTLNDTDAKEVSRARLESLGIKIANEWAQNNDIRLINNSNIATWASAMQTAAERQQHLSFLMQVNNDVQALLSKELSARNITYERYFEEEYFDDF